MTATLKHYPGPGTFDRGIHPAEGKHLAEDVAIEVVAAPAQVVIPLLQHTGAPCEAIVKVKQEVVAGEKIGDSDAFISAPVHTPIAGVVARESVATLPNGRHVKTIPIKAADDQPTPDAVWEDVFGGDWPTGGADRHDPREIAKTVREAGIVGLGGAAFPTSVKLTRNDAKPVDTLLVNGCECEPYLTADYRLMLEAPQPVVAGAILAAHACGAKNVVIAVEDNKPLGATKLAEAAQGTQVEIAVVETKYPMGGERQVIPAVLGREVPTGGLPLDVGVVVVNVGTAAAIARAVLRGKALTHRVVTVTGPGIAQPKNLLVPVGISFAELIDHCGGLTADAVRVIAGGPMMGFALASFAAPVTKGTSGIVALRDQEVRKADETTCVRCGRCVDVCPLGLVATRMALAARHKDWELAKRYHIQACCECGCCAYVCPASIPLVQLMRMGKAQMPRE